MVLAVLGLSGYSHVGNSLGRVQRNFAALCRSDARLNSVDRLILSLLLSNPNPLKKEKDVRPAGGAS